MRRLFNLQLLTLSEQKEKESKMDLTTVNEESVNNERVDAARDSSVVTESRRGDEQQEKSMNIEMGSIDSPRQMSVVENVYEKHISNNRVTQKPEAADSDNLNSMEGEAPLKRRMSQFSKGNESVKIISQKQEKK